MRLQRHGNFTVRRQPSLRGLVELVSSGLLCLQVGLKSAGAMLAVADAWASQSPS